MVSVAFLLVSRLYPDSSNLSFIQLPTYFFLELVQLLVGWNLNYYICLFGFRLSVISYRFQLQSPAMLNRFCKMSCALLIFCFFSCNLPSALTYSLSAWQTTNFYSSFKSQRGLPLPKCMLYLIPDILTGRYSFCALPILGTNHQSDCLITLLFLAGLISTGEVSYFCFPRSQYIASI